MESYLLVLDLFLVGFALLCLRVRSGLDLWGGRFLAGRGFCLCAGLRFGRRAWCLLTLVIIVAGGLVGNLTFNTYFLQSNLLSLNLTYFLCITYYLIKTISYNLSRYIF